MGERFLTTQEAAQLARCDPRVIRRAITQGELEAMFSSRWLLAADDVEGWLRERARERLGNPPVRHRKCAAKPSHDRPGSVARLTQMSGEQGPLDTR